MKLGASRAPRMLLATTIVALGTMVGLSAAHADDFLDGVKANVAKLVGPQTTWEGPTDPVKPQPGKLVVFVAVDMQNDAAVQYSAGIEEAAKAIGWKEVTIDGRGTVSGQQEATNQAIALKPAAIIISADAQAIKDEIKEANSRGIIVIGIHAAATSGPVPELGLDYNVQTEATAIGQAQADWIIANSEGKGRVIVTTDCLYAIACAKAHAAEARIKECATCTLLEFNSSPAGEAQQREPALIAAWVQKYGLPLYITTVSDYFVDFQVPALRAGGVDPKQVILVSSDGSRAAYQRIKAADQYQLVTVPEPATLQAYQAVDEAIRLDNKMPAAVLKSTPYLVTPDNVTAEGGDKNVFEPTNDFRKHYLALWGVAN